MGPRALSPQKISESELGLGDFLYPLPEQLIAQEALKDRTAARLFWRAKCGAINTEHHIRDLVQLIEPGTLIIYNDTRVFPARLYGSIDRLRKGEVFLLEEISSNPQSSHWKALGKPLKHLKESSLLEFEPGLRARITKASASKATGPEPFEITFDCDTQSLKLWLEVHGHIPLPPYIRRTEPQNAATSPDKMRYQTVYASLDSGSVAAPTAGLHFSPELVSEMKAKGINFAPLRLHVGAGTFLPVKSEDLSLHTMHKEKFLVPQLTLAAIKKAKAEAHKIIAIGTTSLRALESFYLSGQKTDEWLETALFIYPRSQAFIYKPQVFDALMTNFHQPGSSLVMLVAALLGYPQWQKAYQEAIKEEYRFLSYGDSCLLWL